MAGKRYTADEIIGLLLAAEAGLENGDRTLAEVCHLLGFSKASFYKWLAKYGQLESETEAERQRFSESIDRSLQNIKADLQYNGDISLNHLYKEKKYTAPQFTDHITIFLDLLGFKAASGQPDRLIELLTLLQTMAKYNRDHEIDTKDWIEEPHVAIRPAVTAFSDSIVISYSITDIVKYQRVIPTYYVAQGIQHLIAAISWKALKANLLVRGGVSVGPLYHAGGVVMGPALVDAYELESKFAVYPRILVSDSVITHNNLSDFKKQIRIDTDGRAYLAGIIEQLLIGRVGVSPQDIFVSIWSKYLRKIIRQNISSLRRNKYYRQMEKWQWFLTEFERTVKKFDPKPGDTAGPFGLHRKRSRIRPAP